MKAPRGFTVLELVFLVAVAGIVAAIVIPALVRARVAANESATVGDIHTLISAQTAYRSANVGFYDGNLDCLVDPDAGNCIPSYPTSGPSFLDSMLASQQSKAGYNRSFAGARPPAPIPAQASATSVQTYRYDATPAAVGETGVRGFAGDASGRVCFTSDGSRVPPGPDVGTLPPGCLVLR